MITTLIELFRESNMLYHIWITLYETIIGFILAVGLGYVIALCLWWSERLRRVLEPYIVVLNSLPKIALGPVIIIPLYVFPNETLLDTILETTMPFEGNENDPLQFQVSSLDYDNFDKTKDYTFKTKIYLQKNGLLDRKFARFDAILILPDGTIDHIERAFDYIG